MSVDYADSEQAEFPPPPEEATIQERFASLMASGRELADAELEWAKIKAGIVAAAFKKGSLFGGLALFFLFLGLLLLVAAAVIALAPLVGLLWATLITAATAFILAALLGIAAKNALASAFAKEDE